MKFNPFCMCCAVSKQEQKIRSFQDMDKKVEYMKKVMDRMASIDESGNYREEFLSSAFIIIDHTVCDKFHTA